MSSSFYNQQHPSSLSSIATQTQRIPGSIAIHGQNVQQQQQPVFRASSNDQFKKQSHSKPAKSGTLTLAPDALHEAAGDELDNISARDIAIARYKRNHDYLSEIFTPYDSESIRKAPIQLNHTNEQVEKLIDDYKERSVQQRIRHKDRMMNLEQQQKVYWELMNKLNEADSIELIDKVSSEISDELHVKVEHTKDNVKSLSILDIEEEDLMNTTES